ncbi:hypothetical protein [Xenorhabdus mauleonii]|nr:hypothetical protein [Xenorhabdus mauleonii]
MQNKMKKGRYDTLEFGLPEEKKVKKTETLYHVGDNQPVDYIMEFKEE